MAEHKDIFPKKKYKNSFSLNELKNKSKFFKIYDTIEESYNDIKSFSDQSSFFIQTQEKSLSLGIKKQIGIPYDIVFPLKEEPSDLNEIVSELYTKYMNLEKSVENNNNELKLKNINLEKKCNELEIKNINLEKKINELYEKYELICQKYNELSNIKENKKIVSNTNEESNLISKIQLFFDKPIKGINLVYNGFDRNEFFDKCSGKNNLLFLVKDINGNEFGGYMSSTFIKNENNKELIIKDKNAFIFNIQKKKKFHVIKPDKAINLTNSYFICFGGSSLDEGNDLYIYEDKIGGMNTTDYYGDRNYETSNGRTKFKLSEFRVYHINI